MIIARGTCEHGQLILLGLSSENLRRLLAGQPISCTRESHGEGVPEGWHLAILHGDTEADIIKQLDEAQAVEQKTKNHLDPRAR